MAATRCAVAVRHAAIFEREFALTLESRAAIRGGADRALAGKEATGVCNTIIYAVNVKVVPSITRQTAEREIDIIVDIYIVVIFQWF